MLQNGTKSVQNGTKKQVKNRYKNGTKIGTKKEQNGTKIGPKIGPINRYQNFTDFLSVLALQVGTGLQNRPARVKRHFPVSRYCQASFIILEESRFKHECSSLIKQ
jgi:hypothetical protein